MVKIKVVTQTEYRIELPIESFDEISEDNMPIEESDKMIIDFLAEKYDVGVDKILYVMPI